MIRASARLFLIPLLAALGGAEAGPWVRYGEFGAKGDGRTDDLEALVRAHEHANRTGLPVRADDGATYYLGGAARTIVVRTDTDFGRARYLIDDTKAQDDRKNVFEVLPTLEKIPNINVKSLVKGQCRVDAAFPGPCLLLARDAGTRRFIRRGPNENRGSPQSDVFLVDALGQVDPSTPVLWDFGRLTDLEVLPVGEKPLTLRGGHFTTIARTGESTVYQARGIGVRRCRVLVDGLEHRITGEGGQGPPYRGFLHISNCAHVVVKNCVFSGHRTYLKTGAKGKRVAMGSYDIAIDNAVHVTLLDVKQANDIMDRSLWGIIATNFCKNLLLDGCRLSRFDAHQGVTHATIRRSTIGHMGVQLTGAGEFLMENSTVQSDRLIVLRPDYGSTWNGNITIRNCRFLANGNATIVDGANDGQHDFGYPCRMPERLVVDGLAIDDGGPSRQRGGPLVFGNFNPRFTDDSYREAIPYGITREVEIRRVTTSSGRPLRLSENPFLFRNVKVTGL